MLQDLKFALRTFRRDLGLAIVALALAHSRHILRICDGRILYEGLTERL
jgi:hypothetical protein